MLKMSHSRDDNSNENHLQGLLGRQTMLRFLRVTVAGIVAAAFAFLPLMACAADEIAERPTTLQPPSRTNDDVFSAQDSGAVGVGLRRPAHSLRERIELPFGLNYSRESKSLLLPLDDKNEWGVGINLNVMGAPAVDLNPPGLQLAPKRTPGLMLQRKF